MTDKATFVFKGFLKLSSAEKSEVLSGINEFYKADTSQRDLMEKAYGEKRSGVVLGPISATCPCCGR